jgi:hypothetical protein
MIINDLETMENIVNNNNTLSWIGWDVVERHKTQKAKTSKDGIFVDGYWYTQKVYPVTREGWSIPQKLVR